jgi:hypothetical protein
MTSTVTVNLPEGWLEIDPRQPDIAAELRRTVRERLDVEADTERVVQVAGPLAAELRRLTADTDVLIAGFFAEFILAGDQRLVTTASLILAISPPVQGLAEVRRALATKSADRTRIRTADLPAGEAVVSTATITLTRPEWPDTIPALLTHYFIPVPGSDRIATLCLLTPNVDLAGAFDVVFDAIAESVAFTP